MRNNPKTQKPIANNAVQNERKKKYLLKIKLKRAIFCQCREKNISTLLKATY